MNRKRNCCNPSQNAQYSEMNTVLNDHISFEVFGEVKNPAKES